MKNTSKTAFQNNVKAFVETLNKLGFVLNVSEYEEDTEQDIVERRNAKMAFILDLDVEKEYNRDLLSGLKWVKELAEDAVYVFVDFENSSSFAKSTHIRDIKVIITDDRNGIPCKDYRKINMPSANTLAKRIDSVKNAIEAKNEEYRLNQKAREVNAPKYEAMAKEIFGAENVTVGNGKWSIIVNYHGFELRISTLNDTPILNIDVFKIKKEVSLEKAKQIIDILIA